MKQITDSQRKFLDWIYDNKDLSDYVASQDSFKIETLAECVSRIIVQGKYDKQDKTTLNSLREQYLLEYKFQQFNDGDLLYLMDDVKNQWLFSIRKRSYKNTFKQNFDGIYIECYDKYDLINKRLKGSSDILMSYNPKILKKANSAQTDLMTRKIKEKTKLQ